MLGLIAAGILAAMVGSLFGIGTEAGPTTENCESLRDLSREFPLGGVLGKSHAEFLGESTTGKHRGSLMDNAKDMVVARQN